MTGVTIKKKTEVEIEVGLTTDEINELILTAARKKLKRKLPDDVTTTFVVNVVGATDEAGLTTDLLTAKVLYSYSA